MKEKIKNIKLFGYRSDTTTVPVEIVDLEDTRIHILVKIEIDGIQGDMIIDTGASVTVIDQKLFPDNIKVKTLTKSMHSGSVN